MKGSIPHGHDSTEFWLFQKLILEIPVPDAKSDFGTKMARVLTAGYEMMFEAVRGILESWMTSSRGMRSARMNGKLCARIKRTVMTVFGDLSFERRYYRNRQTGEMAYLLDRRPGIQGNAKVIGDVRQKAM